jgi:hypothetical protein
MFQSNFAKQLDHLKPAFLRRAALINPLFFDKLLQNREIFGYPFKR